MATYGIDVVKTTTVRVLTIRLLTFAIYPVFNHVVPLVHEICHSVAGLASLRGERPDRLASVDMFAALAGRPRDRDTAGLVLMVMTVWLKCSVTRKTLTPTCLSGGKSNFANPTELACYEGRLFCTFVTL